MVISIIVLLILAGVSIMTLAGDNGLLNRTTSAKEKTEQAGIMENIKLAYQNALIGRYANNENNSQIAEQIATDLKGIYGQDSGVTVTEENGVYTVTTPDGRYTIDASGSVSRVEGLTISQTSLNLQKREGEEGTPTTITATKYGIEGTVSWSITQSSEVVSINATTGDEIHVTPKAGGTATITVTCGDKSKECTVTVTEVNKVAVTFNLGGGTVNDNTAEVVIREFPEETITLPTPTAPSATPTYTLKGWYDAATEGNQVYAANLTTTIVPNSATTVYAQWKEPAVAFRSYGEARNTGTYGNAYSIGAITVNGVSIADNWKKFYEDDDFIYVIYGDYYPAGAQTEITDGNAIFAPARTSDSNYQTASTYLYSVNSGGYRTTLLRYLKNNNSYSWDSTNRVDSYGANGETYTSWDNLKTAVVNATGKSAADITIQGSPDIDLWVKSWNAKYSSSAKLKVTKESNGYNIMLDEEDSNSNYSASVTHSPYNGANDETNGKGYYDRLYFPNRGSTATQDETNADKSEAYWIASPGTRGGSALCAVYCYGNVFCGSYYNISNYYCHCARPVIAIAK